MIKYIICLAVGMCIGYFIPKSHSDYYDYASVLKWLDGANSRCYTNSAVDFTICAHAYKEAK